MTKIRDMETQTLEIKILDFHNIPTHSWSIYYLLFIVFKIMDFNPQSSCYHTTE